MPHPKLPCGTVALVRPGGKHYFLDVVVGERTEQGAAIRLVEVEGAHLANSLAAPDKATARHRFYRRPLVIMKEDSG